MRRGEAISHGMEPMKRRRSWLRVAVPITVGKQSQTQLEMSLVIVSTDSSILPGGRAKRHALGIRSLFHTSMERPQPSIHTISI